VLFVRLCVYTLLKFTGKDKIAIRKQGSWRGAAQNKKRHPSRQIVHWNKKLSSRKETLWLKHNNPDVEPTLAGSLASPRGRIHFRQTQPKNKSVHQMQFFNDFHQFSRCNKSDPFANEVTIHIRNPKGLATWTQISCLPKYVYRVIVSQSRVRFSKMYFPRRAGKRTPKIVKSQNVRILSVFLWFYPFTHANSMQKTPPMHLNTSPTCFEGSGTGKREKNTKP